MNYLRAIFAAACALPALAAPASADTSAAATLQLFESSWRNSDARAADAFVAGYGGVWVPPPGRADSGPFSVGYDQFDRFDLGTWNNPTLYGTERGARSMIDAWRRFGAGVTADLVWNHNGFADLGTPDFLRAGGYPGFVLTRPDAIDGDFHSRFATGIIDGRLSGLIDINHSRNFRYVRSPVDAGDPRNIPAGTQPRFGRIANVPDAANRRFYPSQSGPGRTLFDPRTNETFVVHDFRGNGGEIFDGTPVEENALGYLMRNAQWYVQDVGFDGFRLDATKHMQPWVLDYFDRAVHNANPRRRLDGSVNPVFSFGEALEGDFSLLQAYVRKDSDPSRPNVVGGNRDTLDFPLHFALKANLTSNGQQNDWRNLADASFDRNDDGLANNGSQGVAFDASHDDNGADLGNVANAFLAMRPGNWVVYHNAKEFGNGRDFPRDGRGDALGGLYGETITSLVGLRNTHGRGNYRERHLDKETLVYEREGSAVVGLSNRLDGGFDTRWVDTGFSAGTRLVELTGNARDTTIDPFGDIPDVVVVQADGRAQIRVPRNVSAAGNRHDKGYVVYGLATPEGTLSLGGVSQVIAGGTPTDATNGTTRLADYHVVTGDAFTVTLQTTPVTLADGFRDRDADGDNALLKLNGGVDVNGNGRVDFVTPGSVVYGFEQFGDKRSPLAPGGDGGFVQTVDATGLREGVNYVEARAFRRRTDGGPAVFSTFKKVIYVDRLPPESAIAEVNDLGGANRQFVVESLDGTANSVHVFANLPENADPLALVSGGNRAGQVDRDLFAYGFDALPSGNSALTVVTYEVTGNVNVQRFGGVTLDTGIGLGVGDLNHDGTFGANDVFGPGAFEEVLYSRGDRFNPAADVLGDGRVTTNDLWALRPVYEAAGAADAAAEARRAELRRGNVNLSGTTDASDIDFLFANLGGDYDWVLDLNADGVISKSDIDVLVDNVFETVYGDANLDGRVDIRDFALLRANFGQSVGWAGGDFTGTGRVTIADFALLRSAFGFDRDRAGSFGTLSHTLPTSIPEPAAVAVLTLTFLGLFRRRREHNGVVGRIKGTHLPATSAVPPAVCGARA